MANGNDTQKNSNGGNLGFEAEMFKAADKLRGNMEPSDYIRPTFRMLLCRQCCSRQKRCRRRGVGKVYTS